MLGVFAEFERAASPPMGPSRPRAAIGGVRGVYDRHQYIEEKRRAFEALATEIERIVHPVENVVAMTR